MSRFMLHHATTNKEVSKRDITHQPILFSQRPSMLKEDISYTPFTPNENVKPSQKPNIELKFNTLLNLEEEVFSAIRWQVNTTDGTNHPTFMMDSLSQIDLIEFEINNSREKLKWEGREQISILFANWIKEHCNPDISIEQFLASWRNEFNTYTGKEVDDSANVHFYLPMAPFIPFLQGVILNGLLSNLKIQIRFTPVPTDVDTATTICKSNTTSNAYNASVTFNDISYVRQYRLVGDKRTAAVAPDLKQLTVLVPQYEQKVYTQAWNTVGGNRLSFKVSEIAKRKYVQSVHVWVRKVETAYNSATSQMKYSGHNYIAWKIEQLFGNREVLDLTSAQPDHDRRLRAYEIEQHRRRYSHDLPISVYTESDNLGKTYLGDLTVIYFDHVKIEKDHNEVVTNVNPDIDDYQITLECNGSVGASCEVNVMVEYYDMYNLNENRQLVKIL